MSILTGEECVEQAPDISGLEPMPPDEALKGAGGKEVCLELKNGNSIEGSVAKVGRWRVLIRSGVLVIARKFCNIDYVVFRHNGQPPTGN